MWRWITRGLMLSCLLALLTPVLSAQTFAGFIEKPAEGATVSGMVLVQGWAIDQQQISKVDLFVDDQFQHSAEINLPRVDIIEANPTWPGIQSKLPGFQTGFLASRFSNGPHTVHVMVTTSDNQTYEVGRRTVTVDNTINQPPFGFVETPDTSSIVDTVGSFPVSGWVTDTDGIDHVDVLVDDLNLQGAVYGDARPDVSNSFPDFPAAMFSGFVAFVDTTRIQDGVHTLSIRATDRQGLSRVIGKRNIQVYNTENQLRPFGHVDQPLRDAVLYGNCASAAPPISPVPASPGNHITPVTGWTLDLGHRADLGRVSYVELMVDGVPWYSSDQCGYYKDFGGFVNCYGLPRFDVARLYPNYPDSPRSGFMFTLDVATLMTMGVPAGHHTLKVRVGDQEQTFADIPDTSGIPVFFTCTNSEFFDFASLGYIDFPHSMDYVKGTIDLTGWAIDENAGVRTVKIIIDGNYIGNAQYGMVRTDVQSAYPFINGSKTAGWRFTLDTTLLSDARHRLTVQTIDAFGNTSEIGSMDFYVDNPQ
ncbi:MAG: Ig-like domain-containing protein [Thermoanaerobaculia bacterium]